MDDLAFPGVRGDRLAVIPGGLVDEADAFPVVGVGHHDVVFGGRLHVVVPAVLVGHDAAVDHVRALEIFREVDVGALGGDSDLAGTGVAGVNTDDAAVVTVLGHLLPVDGKIDGRGGNARSGRGGRHEPFGVAGDRVVEGIVAVVGDGESRGGGLVVVDQGGGGAVQLAGIGCLRLADGADHEGVETGFRTLVLTLEDQSGGTAAEVRIDAVGNVGVGRVHAIRIAFAHAPAVGVVAHLVAQLQREQLLLAKVPGPANGGELIERRFAGHFLRSALIRLRVEGPGVGAALHGIRAGPETSVEDQHAAEHHVVGAVDLHAGLIGARAHFAGLDLDLELHVVFVDVDRRNIEIAAEVGVAVSGVLDAHQKRLGAAGDRPECVRVNDLAEAVGVGGGIGSEALVLGENVAQLVAFGLLEVDPVDFVGLGGVNIRGSHEHEGGRKN